MKLQNADKNQTKKELNVYEKRFHLMMKLYRIHCMLKNAKITFADSK